MPGLGFFSRLKGKDGAAAKGKKGQTQEIDTAPAKPAWTDAWTRTTVEPEEIQELLRGCTVELKSKALDMPFFLLPFRPTSDPSAARTFIRNFFDTKQPMRGDYLAQELRLTEPMVLCSVLKWCWSRLSGGVVSWDAYELFRTGEHDSNMARDSFATFIPLSVDSDARTKIIFDFFELLAAIAAHGNKNGLGGRKLSRLAGWWAFEHTGSDKGFDGGYKGWAAAADATSHLFFAYLRSMSPESSHGIDGINTLPRSLQKLVAETEYPPQMPSLMLYTTPKVVMIVDSVSPTPFALLRRANNFHYRDQDAALQEFSNFEDPVKALTDECRRVLRSISNSNQTTITSQKNSSGLKDASWSRFEDIGFSGAFDETEEDEDRDDFAGRRRQKPDSPKQLRSIPHSGTVDMGRPTTPSWADFLSSGFVEEQGSAPSPLLLPPDKILPQVEILRGRSSQSHKPRLESERNLEPGELASISSFDLDESFWWVWISSLAGEEPAQRKAAFGRCALVETIVPQGKWIVIEEQIKGAAPEPVAGAYVAEKKTKFWSRRGKNTVPRSKSSNTGKSDSVNPAYLQAQSTASKTSVGGDQHARIQKAAAALQHKQKQAEIEQHAQQRRGRDETDATKTNSIMTLQPAEISELSPALKWASKYDKEAIREQYLTNSKTGKGAQVNGQSNGNAARAKSPNMDRDLPAVPQLSAKSETNLQKDVETIMTPSAVPPAPLPPTPAADKQTYTGNVLADKDIEAPVIAKLPQDTHPAERERPSTPLRMKGDSESSHLITPPRKTQQQSLAQFLSEGESKKDQTTAVRPSGESPERQKLQKKTTSSGENKVTSGIKGIFGRKKNRNSIQMTPDAAAIAAYAVKPPASAQKENVNPYQGLEAPQSGGMSKRFGSFRKKSSPVVTPLSEKPAMRAPESIREDTHPEDMTPAESQTPQQQEAYDPSVNGSQSRLDTADAHEARQEFSRFDQGPMGDMPAFAPDNDIDDHDEIENHAPSAPNGKLDTSYPEVSPLASPMDTPPTVVPAVGPPVDPKKLTGMLKPARKPVEVAAPVAAESSLTPAQDRWAQIRKQAAERAAQRSSEDQRTVTSDGDGETSGEETIESRVARIKARVAELTGNMEDGANASRTQSPSRR